MRYVDEQGGPIERDDRSWFGWGILYHDHESRVQQALETDGHGLELVVEFEPLPVHFNLKFAAPAVLRIDQRGEAFELFVNEQGNGRSGNVGIAVGDDGKDFLPGCRLQLAVLAQQRIEILAVLLQLGALAGVLRTQPREPVLQRGHEAHAGTTSGEVVVASTKPTPMIRPPTKSPSTMPRITITTAAITLGT